MEKAGIKTSEFWVSLVGLLIPLGILAGYIGQNDTDYILALAKDIVSGVVAVIALVGYIQARVAVKKSIISADAIKVYSTIVKDEAKLIDKEAADNTPVVDTKELG